MVDTAHEDITDPEIHEPKGASTATADQVYAADGAGSGAWTKITGDNLDVDFSDVIQGWLDDDTLTTPSLIWLTATIADISTPEVVVIPIPSDCTVLGAHLVLEGAITLADAVISFKDGSAASLGTSVTVPFSGSAAGDEFDFTATTNQDLTGPTFIQIATDGGSTDAQRLFITVAVQVG